MIEISSLTALIIAEVLIGLVILSALLLLFTLLRKQRIRKAANHLAERIQADKATRTERLKTLLEGRYQQQGALLDQTLRNMMQMEMMLYQNILNGFLKDDQVFLQQVDVDVENLVMSYQSLEPAGSGGKAAATSSAEEDDELDRLKTENERLSEELKVTMDTMGRMLNEYSTMFSDGVENFENSISQIDPTAATTQIEPESGVAEAESSIADDMVIPDMTEQELAESAAPQVDDLSATGEEEKSEETDEDVDEEVSEIIDEVMEIADEMIQEGEPDEVEQVGESMVDDLDKIDIEIPGVDETPTEGAAEAEAGSLEEEWAKLLEEESSEGDQDKSS